MTDRTQGILNRASEAEKFSGVRWILGDGVITNYMQSFVDETMKRNAIFQSNAGVSPKIVRRSPGWCCEWCAELEGTYMYPDDVPDDVYRRHDNCNCIVEFYPADGKKQDVWTGEWTKAEPNTLKERKRLGDYKKVTVAQLEERKRIGLIKEPIVAPNGQNNTIIVKNKKVTVTEEDHIFGANNGNYPSKTLKAEVYTTEDGAKFYFQKNINGAHQQLTPRELISVYEDLPQEVKTRAQKVVEVVDYYNPADAYWKKHYKRFNHSYATGGDNVTFWRYDGTTNWDYVKETLNHEAGHHIDKSIAPKTGNYSDSVGWTKAMKDDKILSGKKSPTPYGENSNAEDFAVSVAEYEKNKSAFKTNFPNRAKLLERIFDYSRVELFT